VLSEEFFDDPGLRQRFVDEGKSAARLNHPNVLAVFDIGSAGGYPFIATEFVAGGTLRDRLQQPMAPAEALRIARELGSALDYAHSQGVFHRDIKPANIMFRADGGAVLGDLGILKAQSEGPSMMMGSPHYMSPEQIEGASGDGRSDLYSLGVVLFEMLTGRPPFDADDPFVVIGKHLSDPVPTLPEGISLYQPLIDRTLAKSADDRFANARELMSAIDSYLDPKTVRELRAVEPPSSRPAKPANAKPQATKVVAPVQTASPPTVQQPIVPNVLPSRTPPAPKSNPKKALLRIVSVLIVLALLAAAAYFLIRQPAPTPADVAPDPATRQLAATQGNLSADLARADRLLAQGQLFEPPGDNAFEVLNRLSMQPVDQAAVKQGLTKLADATRQEIERLAARGNRSEAFRLLDLAKSKLLPSDWAALEARLGSRP
jgi:serine/threonine-protein kinase PpkA